MPLVQVTVRQGRPSEKIRRMNQRGHRRRRGLAGRVTGERSRHRHGGAADPLGTGDVTLQEKEQQATGSAEVGS